MAVRVEHLARHPARCPEHAHLHARISWRGPNADKPLLHAHVEVADTVEADRIPANKRWFHPVPPLPACPVSAILPANGAAGPSRLPPGYRRSHPIRGTLLCYALLTFQSGPARPCMPQAGYGGETSRARGALRCVALRLVSRKTQDLSLKSWLAKVKSLELCGRAQACLGRPE